MKFYSRRKIEGRDRTMNFLCIKDYSANSGKNFYKGKKYACCAVLCGWQVSTIPDVAWNDERITVADVAFVPDECWKKHFKIV